MAHREPTAIKRRIVFLVWPTILSPVSDTSPMLPKGMGPLTLPYCKIQQSLAGTFGNPGNSPRSLLCMERSESSDTPRRTFGLSGGQVLGLGRLRET